MLCQNIFFGLTMQITAHNILRQLLLSSLQKNNVLWHTRKSLKKKRKINQFHCTQPTFERTFPRILRHELLIFYSSNFVRLITLRIILCIFNSISHINKVKVSEFIYFSKGFWAIYILYTQTHASSNSLFCLVWPLFLVGEKDRIFLCPACTACLSTPKPALSETDGRLFRASQ